MMCIINEIVLRLVLEKNFIGSHAPSPDGEGADVVPELKSVKEWHMVDQETGGRVRLIRWWGKPRKRGRMLLIWW